MNWDAIGAVGEIIGAAAVVVSLAYLAIQIRQSNQLQRRSATSASVAAFREWSATLVSRPELVRIYRVGMTGTANLASDDERATFIALASTFLKAMEDIHYQFMTGALDDDVWRGWAWIGQGHITTPGMQDYWSNSRLAAGPAFREWVESLPQSDRSFEQRMAALSKSPG